MSLLTANSRNDYTGNGATATYSYTFRIQNASDLVVIRRNLSSVATTLVLNTDYTVTGAGSANGGTITLTAGNLTSGFKLSILRVVPLTQTTDIRNQGAFFPEIHEDVFDKLTAIDQQQQDAIERSLRLPPAINPSGFNMELPSDVAGNPDATIIVNPTGDGLAVGPTATAVANASANAIAAAASASAASTSATNAAASAASAAASAAAGAWKDVVFVTSASSPITIAQADSGKLYVADCTSGNIVFNLPSIAALNLSQGWSLGIKKSDGTANTVTVNANGADLVEGASSFQLTRQNFGATLLPDLDPSPDAWTAVFFGDVRNLYFPTIYNPQTDVVAYQTQGSAPATPSAGYVKTYVKTADSKMYMLKSDGSETAIGSGSGGGINYVTNPDSESATTGWATYADAAASVPVDGTGGTPNVTWTRTTSSQLRGLGSFLYTKDAVNRQGQGVSYAFTTDRADRFQVLRGSFEYEVASGTYADDVLEVFIYDVTNAALIYCTPSKIKNSGIIEKFAFEFQTSSSTSYRLIIHNASTSATAFTMKFDNFSVGPNAKSYGSQMTDWKYANSVAAGTLITAEITNPTYGTVQNNICRWMRSGPNAIIEWDYRQTAAGSSGSGIYYFNIPSEIGLIDTVVKPPNTNTVSTAYDEMNSSVGTVYITGSGGYSYAGAAVVHSNSKVKFITSYTGPTQSATVFHSGDSSAFGSSAKVAFTLRMSVPITGWSAQSQVVSSDADGRVVAFRGDKVSNEAVTADVTNIAFSAVVDTHGAWNGTQWTCPVSGVYDFIMRADSSTGGTTCIWVNGVKTAYLTNHYNAQTISGSTILQLKAGDVVAFRCQNTITINGTASLSPTSVTIKRMAGPSQVIASEKVEALISGAVQTTYTANTNIVWPTKNRDTHGAYNATTGDFTAPMTATYQFTIGFNTNVTDSNRVYVTVSGAEQSPALNYTRGGFATGTVNVFMLAGQVASVRCVAAWSTSSSTGSGLNIVKL